MMARRTDSARPPLFTSNLYVVIIWLQYRLPPRTKLILTFSTRKYILLIIQTAVCLHDNATFTTIALYNEENYTLLSTSRRGTPRPLVARIRLSITKLRYSEYSQMPDAGGSTDTSLATIDFNDFTGGFSLGPACVRSSRHIFPINFP